MTGRGRGERLGRLPRALAAAGAEWVEAAQFEPGRPGPRPTAVIAATDQLALGVVEAAREAGLRLPETCRWSASTTSPAPRGRA